MKLVAATIFVSAIAANAVAQPVRFATFNVSLARSRSGQLIEDLSTRGTAQAKQVAEIIQRVRPDVILLNEFDYDANGRAVELFHQNYLSVGQGDQRPIVFAHRFTAPVNTGVPTSVDLNRDGKTDGPNDAFGFGRFPGQYGMVVYSKFAIDREQVRTFQKLLWKDKPNADLPKLDGESPYYSPEALDLVRLSSKSHWDLPIKIGDRVIHFLCAHPTPPVFDGPEDRHGLRNFDEVGLWADYLDSKRSEYIRDDRGRRGGLPSDASFVIAGDMNADPFDGDSRRGAIDQLLRHPRVNGTNGPSSKGAKTAAEADGGINRKHRGAAEHDTADFDDNTVGNLRIDYVLPSKQMNLVNAGVFWPSHNEPGHQLIQASDHRLVWVDVEWREE